MVYLPIDLHPRILMAEFGNFSGSVARVVL